MKRYLVVIFWSFVISAKNNLQFSFIKEYSKEMEKEAEKVLEG